MSLSSKILLSGLLATLLLFSACEKTAVGDEFAKSGEGNIPEEFMPEDLAVIFSYSSMNDEQFANMKVLKEKLGGEDKFSTLVSDQFEENYGSKLNYEDDLLPALGEQFRSVFGIRPSTLATTGTGSKAEVDSFMVVTLKDKKSMENILDRLVEAGDAELQKLSDSNIYVLQEQSSYMALHEDLLFVSNRPDLITGMLRQDAADSLWAASDYQKDLGEIGAEHVFYAVIYPQKSGEDFDVPMSNLTFGAMPQVITNEALVVTAEADGFAFEGYAFMDKEKADELGISFENVPKEKAYLFEEVPAEGLMAYVESYGLKQGFEEASKLEGSEDSLGEVSTVVQSYLAMDLETEVLSFMDKGYALALHRNLEGIFPGISIFVDVSSDPENAETFLSKIDGQITGLMAVLQGALPGAVKKGTESVNGEDFSSLEIDLSAIPRTQETPLPAAVTGSPMKLLYGIYDNRLLISTALAWTEEGESIGESELYEALSSRVTDADEGVILLDAQGVADYAVSLRGLREQLGLDVGDSFFTGGFFDGFLGALAMSETKPYEAHLRGYLLTAD